ncbi:unnamed protein product [Pleuronectes platessa]|uniref:Uncharacterized protein n=1 Tax=Pleuronectes platessa TaxID=8262 RepID=A0A9N7VUB4_PLEPL|nr:unnamed protein product [Pleuronectes platessa]
MSYDQLLKEEDLSEEMMFHPVEEQDESVPIRPSRRRCNQGTSATELERPRSFTGLLENPRATRKQHREGHSDQPPSCFRPHVVTGVIKLHLETGKAGLPYTRAHTPCAHTPCAHTSPGDCTHSLSARDTSRAVRVQAAEIHVAVQTVQDSSVNKVSTIEALQSKSWIGPG